MKNAQLIILVLMAGTLAMVAACNRNSEVRVYQAPKEEAATQPAEQAMPGHPPMGANHPPIGANRPPVAGAAEAAPIAWTLPQGWKSVPVEQGGMFPRYANLSVDARNPDLIVAVLPLGPQELYSNINRWRGQVGLAPAEHGELDKQIQRLKVDGSEAFVVDLVGPAQANQQPMRMLAALVNRPGRTWSFKLTGPSDKLEPHKGEFMEFVKSIRFGGK